MSRFRPPDPNETSLRYTTLAAIKERLSIPATDTSRDADIILAGVAGEWSLDVWCGRGFPDLDTDPEDPAQITVVPAAVQSAALTTAIAMWKEADAPTGTAGSSDFFGALSVQDSARRAIESSPGMIGFRVEPGFGVA